MVVSLSALSTFVSAVFVVGIPTEVYYYGAMFSMAWIGYILFAFLGAQIFIPFYHDMGYISAYQVGLDLPCSVPITPEHYLVERK